MILTAGERKQPPAFTALLSAGAAALLQARIWQHCKGPPRAAMQSCSATLLLGRLSAGLTLLNVPANMVSACARPTMLLCMAGLAAGG
jgi:hypothetical protein